MLTCNLGFALTTLGARQEARASLERGLALADAIGSSGAVRHAHMNWMGWTATFGPDKRLEGVLAEPREDADSKAQGSWTAPDRANLGTLFYRGWELLRSDNLATLARACSLLRMSAEGYRVSENRDVFPVALGMWALAELKLGNRKRALDLAEEAAELLDGGAPSLLNEAVVYLVLHDCLVALGRSDEAREAAGHGIPHLLRRVKGLEGTPYARTFLTELQHNSELVARAEEYGLVPDSIHRILEGNA
jgi:eukaryotic-like serine/threonine-protein kinase